jgi:hypothetical protein
MTSVIRNKAFDFGDVDFYEARPEGFDVYSWSPGPPGSTEPATQVHMHIPTAFGRIVTRFKGPDTLDRLIAALQAHREDVWGKP